ncbi:MAG: oxidoreductase [Bacillota bacterium]
MGSPNATKGVFICERIFKFIRPDQLRNITIKNRIFMAPTGTGFANYDGAVNDQILCYYLARAVGGAGLIIIEHTLCSDRFWKGSGLLNFGRPGNLPGMKQLAEIIHRSDCRVIVQLSLGLGRQGSSRSSGTDLVAPSPIPYQVAPGTTPRGLKRFEGRQGETPRILSIGEIDDLKKKYAMAIRYIKLAGFDGIEIHGAHGYLLAEFVSPGTNERSDAYGGSFNNRLSLPLELIKLSREIGGEHFIVGYRISGDEHNPRGLTLNDTQKIVPVLVSAGIDYVHLSSGSYEVMAHMIPDRPQAMLNEAVEIKRVSKVPVICPNIHDFNVADELIAENKIDILSASRTLIADPEWPNKLKENHHKDIKKCRLCNTCINAILSGFSLKCVENSSVG